jgi:hypothetical protein
MKDLTSKGLTQLEYLDLLPHDILTSLIEDANGRYSGNTDEVMMARHKYQNNMAKIRWKKYAWK